MLNADQDKEFGPWLGRQLRRAGMTQAQLADKLNLTRAAVSAWITSRAVPRAETQRRIAEILEIDMDAVRNLADNVAGNLPLQWHHRPAHPDGGREYGNAAAFAFGADLSVLAREATQNSLDERRDPTSPVRVHYTLHELTGEHLDAFLKSLRWDELAEHYRAAADTQQKVGRSLRAALDDLDASRSLLLLRIDDYNASGLTGPEYSDGRFAAVVRRQLDSHNKSDKAAGGSYGLGKVTLWATSRFSLVLMNSTLSEPHEGHTERRLVGRLDLPWRTVDGQAYAGPAWFGEPDTEPSHHGVSRSWWADERTVRDLHLERPVADPGTSFLVVGAHDASGDAEGLSDMHEKLVNSLAEAFWAAMIGGRDAGPLLEARVTTLRNGHVLIPEQRVDPRTSRPALCRAFQAYLDGETVDALISGDQVAKTVVPLTVPPLRSAGRTTGEECVHSAVLLLTPADDTEQRNKIVYMRGNRMTVVERRPRDLPLGASPFQAVLLAGYATGGNGPETELAERFLRASEPPEHNQWGRTEELTSIYQRGALSRLREFREAIDEAVRNLIGRREIRSDGGPSVLRELLKLDGPGAVGKRRAPNVPTVRSVIAEVEESGSWHVRVDLRLPDAEDPWLLTPVAKFDVRSGGRPVVGWSLLTAADNCRIENGNLVVAAGARSAVFTGLTDPRTHPVRSSYARLIVDVHKARGGAA
ncbi:helix-turn-helix transcriptional regulator [Crossiella cryophila]|uniref:RNA polymerase primary sigma factor n=1 Tax=Crossiella cryophila TaxID=43355 RepID=A0A7W7FRE6_9PSEU|nr:helix-turn-helix transcriptional regulator [Crossiella cryophila]MBB4675906.1 RNA polymerase primary sigma factor [Crossiella cryophila]